MTRVHTLRWLNARNADEIAVAGFGCDHSAVDDRWSLAIPVAFVCGACVLGYMIASERWLLVAVAVGMMLLLLRPIEVALGLYAFLIPFESMTTFGSGDAPTATLLRYVGLLAICMTIGVCWLRKRITRAPTTARLWSLFVLWAVSSSLWAIEPEKALARIPTAVGLWLLYMVIVSVRISTIEISRVALLTILGGCGASLYSVYMFMQTGGVSGRVSLAEGSGQADPNFFGLTLLLPLSVACGEALSSRTLLRRLFFFIATGLISVAVCLTMSRGMLAAVGVIIIVFLVRYRLNLRVLIPAAVTGMALLFMPREFFERFGEASATRLAGRQDIWQVGIHALQRYGIFGAGLDNFPYAFQKYQGTSHFFAGDQRDAHNIYLAASVEFGILGILLLIAAFRSHFRALPRFSSDGLVSARLVALEAACWGMLIAGLTLNILWRKAFWFVWAFSLASAQSLRKPQDNLSA